MAVFNGGRGLTGLTPPPKCGNFEADMLSNDVTELYSDQFYCWVYCAQCYSVTAYATQTT